MREKSAERRAYEAAGEDANEHFKRHGNVRSPERDAILARLTETRKALIASERGGSE